ncbi:MULTISPECIES: 30S ribosome-binding factor RbfA [Desulfotignum]|jgi:ribosome-binding factor A|uniref:Ribosome-binding factor A n=2 Tax=Desulfotignum TaxID=115780 RepID=S0FU29_9BACT|nr:MULTISPECIES: 30S ribosome-binding factor RbfA [Desulfotignum]EMS78603.1 ribosome-binding factor A [Desulfotignum phosphitoxidans DSM 13687]MBG0780550.1 30S ribosome-binding factor RbfA [Desulfotignum balticum]
MKPYTRAERISIKIQQAITELLTKKISDPRIEMATVSRVKLTPDLRLASIYVTVFGDEDRIAATLAGFKNSKGFIKKHIAPQLGLKYMPELRFFHDDSFDKAARMDALIDSVVKDIPKDSDPGSGESE